MELIGQFPKEEIIKNEDKKKELFVRAICSAGSSDALYIVDYNNGKIKLLNLKTKQCRRVYSVKSSATCILNLARLSSEDLYEDDKFAILEKGPSREIDLVLAQKPNATLQPYEQIRVEQCENAQESQSAGESSLIQLQNSRVVFGIWGAKVLHELSHPSLCTASAARLLESTRRHKLPAPLSHVTHVPKRSMNGVECLALSFRDKSLRVFKVSSLGLEQIHSLQYREEPGRLLWLENQDSLLVHLVRDKKGDRTDRVELVRFDANESPPAAPVRLGPLDCRTEMYNNGWAAVSSRAANNEFQDALAIVDWKSESVLLFQIDSR